MYILPPSISKKIEGYRWQSFTPPAAGKSRRFRGLICHRRSHFARIVAQKGETYPVGALLAVEADDDVDSSQIDDFISNFKGVDHEQMSDISA